MDQIQIIQDKHRKALVGFWDIQESDRILEIGCGQGDTTAVLADKVGEHGFVHAIDPAPETYGAPVTLGEARLKLLNSEKGNRIRIDLETDIFSPVFSENNDLFDYVVLSHCSWYFSSARLLYDTLLKARQYAKKLCFAEWDTRISSTNQLAHYQAVIIQAQCSSFQQNENSNIKTLISPYDIMDIVEAAGWNIIKNDVIDSSYLQDGRWEVDCVLNEYPQIVRLSDNIPQKMKELLDSQIRVLKNTKPKAIGSLNTFAFTAQ